MRPTPEPDQRRTERPRSGTRSMDGCTPKTTSRSCAAVIGASCSRGRWRSCPGTCCTYLSQLGDRLHGHRGRRQHQRRPGVRAAAVRLHVRDRVALRRHADKLDPIADARSRTPEADPKTESDESTPMRPSDTGLTASLFIAVVARHRRHHGLGEPADKRRRRLLRRRPLVHRLPERPRHRRRLHVGRVVPRHLRRHRAVRLRRLPVLDRLPRRLAGRAAARRRAAAQLRPLHDGRPARLPDAAAPGPHRGGDVDRRRLDLLPARPDGRRGRARRAAARRRRASGARTRPSSASAC